MQRPAPKGAKDCSRRKHPEQAVGQRTRKIAETVTRFRQKTTNIIRAPKSRLVHLALAIAAKILHREAHVDRMLVADLVKVAIEKLQHGTTATVRVRPEDVADWNRYFEAIQRRNSGRGEVDPAVEPHNCMLETELGTTELVWTLN